MRRWRSARQEGGRRRGSFSVRASMRSSTLDPDTLDDAELADAVVGLHRQQARLAAATIRLTAALDARRVWADDGSRSCGAWLAHRCRLPIGPGAGPGVVGAPVAEHAGHRRGVRRRGHQPSVTPLCWRRSRAAAPPSSLPTTRRNSSTTHDAWRGPTSVGPSSTGASAPTPTASRQDAAHDEALRRVHLSAGLRGTGHLDGLLTSLGRATVASALGRIEQELFDADWAAARAEHGDAATTGHLTRTPAQRRHDALVEMARRAVTAPADGKRPQPLVSVLVGYETFRGRVCELADRTVITPGTVASLLDEALIERVVFDGPSRVVDLGRARRFTGAVRRALEVLDRGCTHAGCDMPAERCQGDHIQPWSRGGDTDAENGQLRCPYHNRWRWEHGDGDPPAARPQRPPPDADLERRKAWLEAWRARLRASVLARAYGRSGRQLARGSAVDGIAQQVEVARVASGLVDHMHEDPPEVDRTLPVRRDRRDGI